MIEIIREAYTEEIVNYKLEFRNWKQKDSGYCFPCDKEGRVDIKNMKHLGIVNYIRCSLGAAKRSRILI